MNKSECKKYIKRVFTKIQTEDITLEDFVRQMEKEITEETSLYIDIAKIGINNLNNSANEITVKDLVAQVDVILKIYTNREIILKGSKL